MSDTPRTDSLLTAILDLDGYVAHRNCPPTWVSHARELERELNAVTSEVERLRKANLQLREGAEEQKQRIKRLESWIESLEVLEQHSGILPEREWFGSEIGYLRKGEAVYKGKAKP